MSQPVDRSDRKLSPKLMSSDDLLRIISDVYLFPLSTLLLIRSRWVGLGMWGVLLQQPHLFLVGLLALSLIEAVARSLPQDHVATIDPTVRSNGLLCALMAGWTLAPIGLAFPLEVLLVVTVMLVGTYFAFLGKRLLRNTSLPLIIWPYSLMAAIIFALFPLAPAQSAYWFGWPLTDYGGIADLPDVFLNGMGIFVFSPWIVSGALIAVIVLFWSPLMFVAGMLGWASGVLASVVLVQMGAMIYWVPASYNFFLAGMALGAVYFRPGLRGLAFATAGGALTALFAAALQVFLGYSGIAFLPIPFALTLYSGLLTFGNPPFGSPQDRIFDMTRRPEDQRVHLDWQRARWGHDAEAPLLWLPLRGPVEITQGFDGALSHRGDWRHALDFQRPRDVVDATAHGVVARGDIWGNEVFSPVAGEVVAIRQNIEDNPLGVSNYGANWGNYVLIRSSRGFYVMLCHLMQSSVPVYERQRVDVTSVLGLVGNSGRSTMPHLHMQVQAGDEPGGATLPFRLANYLTDANQSSQEWKASGLPAEGDVVTVQWPDDTLRRTLNSMSPGRAVWSMQSAGTVPPGMDQTAPIVLVTKLTEAGRFVIFDKNKPTNRIEAELDIDGWRVISSEGPAGSLIWALAHGLATLPYCAGPGVTWRDHMPAQYFTPFSEQRRWVAQIFGRGLIELGYRCNNQTTDDQRRYVITAEPVNGASGLFISCSVTMCQLRGPVRVELVFPNGQMTFEAGSFEPRDV